MISLTDCLLQCLPSKPPSKKSREILLPPSVARQDVRPIKVERRAALLRSIARGRSWLEAVEWLRQYERLGSTHRQNTQTARNGIFPSGDAPPKNGDGGCRNRETQKQIQQSPPVAG